MPLPKPSFSHNSRITNVDTAGLDDVSRIVVETTDRQTDFIQALLSGKYTRLLFGGGVGGGKTVGSLLALYMLCKVFPGSRWVVIRKDRPTLKRNTVPSFWKTCPMPFFTPERFNKTDLIAVAENGSRIEFVSESFDEDPELTRFDGFEVNGFLLEEANELNYLTYLKCIERSGRWRLDPMPLPLILLTCNPHQGFLKDVFYTPWSKGELKAPYYFVKSLVEDNPHHPPEYIKNLQEIKKRSPVLYRRLVEGSWEAEDTSEQLVSWEYILKSKEPISFEGVPEEDIHYSLGVDVGRHGKDETVWTVLKGTHALGCNVRKIVRASKTDQREVFDETKRLIHKFNIPHDRVWIDVVGIGGGVYDFLVNDGYFVQEIVGGSKQIEQAVETGFKFYNFNAQIGWNVKILFEEQMIGNITDEALMNDIAAQGYEIQGEKSIRLWSKDKMKEKLRRSPDTGDSFKYGVWGQIYDIISPLPSFEIF